MTKMSKHSTSRRFAKTRATMLMIAAASAALATFVMRGESAAQARDDGASVSAETKADKLAIPGGKEGATTVQPCAAKPVRVVYGGYGEYACSQKTAL